MSCDVSFGRKAIISITVCSLQGFLINFNEINYVWHTYGFNHTHRTFPCRSGTCASLFASFCAIVHFVRIISAKDFPHIYNGRNLRKTAPPVAREGRRTLILISCCEDLVLIKKQQEYRDWWFHLIKQIVLIEKKQSIMIKTGDSSLIIIANDVGKSTVMLFYL